MKRKVFTVLIVLVLNDIAGAIDSAQIIQIRHNYATVNRELAAHYYRKQIKDGPVCGDISSEYARWIDSHGKVRKMAVNVYGDSIALGFTEKYELWFDTAGRLDFVLFRKTHNTGEYLQTQKQIVEMRAYYNEQGQVLRFLNKYPISKTDVKTHSEQFKKLALDGWQTADKGC